MTVQLVPHSKHSISVIKASQLTLYGEIIAVCSQIHTEHINTQCGQNVELLNVKPGGTYSNHWRDHHSRFDWANKNMRAYLQSV